MFRGVPAIRTGTGPAPGILLRHAGSGGASA